MDMRHKGDVTTFYKQTMGRIILSNTRIRWWEIPHMYYMKIFQSLNMLRFVLATERWSHMELVMYLQVQGVGKYSIK
jgi:hypothetical protein